MRCRGRCSRRPRRDRCGRIVPAGSPPGRYCLSKSKPRPQKNESRPCEIERFGSQAHGRFHIFRAGVEFGFGLRGLIARKIAQQHLLGLIFQRHAQRILLQEHLLGLARRAVYRSDRRRCRDRPAADVRRGRGLKSVDIAAAPAAETGGVLRSGAKQQGPPLRES